MADDRVRILECGITVVRPAARAFVHDGAEAFDALLSGAVGEHDVVVDLAEVGAFGDSSHGLRVAMRAYKALKAKGLRIALAAPAPWLAEKLRIARLNLVIPVHDTVDGAVAAFAPRSAQAGQGSE